MWLRRCLSLVMRDPDVPHDADDKNDDATNDADDAKTYR